MLFWRLVQSVCLVAKQLEIARKMVTWGNPPGIDHRGSTCWNQERKKIWWIFQNKIGNGSSYKKKGNEVEDQGKFVQTIFLLLRSITNHCRNSEQHLQNQGLKKEYGWATFCHFLKHDFLLVSLYNPAKVQPSTIKHAVISKCLSLSYSFAMESSSESISVRNLPCDEKQQTRLDRKGKTDVFETALKALSFPRLFIRFCLTLRVKTNNGPLFRVVASHSLMTGVKSTFPFLCRSVPCWWILRTL